MNSATSLILSPKASATSANRRKLAETTELSGTDSLDSYITWTRYNNHNQPLLVVYPEGNSVEYYYDDGYVDLGSGTASAY